MLGAGDGFMCGLLKGWLDGEPWPTALKYANACGAFAVSRHGCTPAYPSWEELQFFLKRGIVRPDLRHDAELEQVHWATNRQAATGRPCGSSPSTTAPSSRRWRATASTKGGAFKELCLDAALKVQDGAAGLWHPLRQPDRARRRSAPASGTRAVDRAAGGAPGSRPLELEPELGPDCGALGEWARENVVKVLCFCHPDDDAETRAAQEATVKRLFTAGAAQPAGIPAGGHSVQGRPGR